MQKNIELGIAQITQNGNSLVMRLPREWLAEYGLEVGTPVYQVLTIDGEIRVHLEQMSWTRKSKIRMINGNGHLTLVRDLANRAGLVVGDVVELTVNVDDGVLMINRVGE